MEMDIDKLKEKIIEIGIQLLKENLTHGTCGNISCRVDKEKILITPSSLPYRDIKPDDILLVNLDGEVLEGKRNPSVETPFHTAIYKNRDDVKAIIHTHSQYALAVSSVVDSIPGFLDEIFSHIGGELTVSRYALPGSDELAENLLNVLGDKNAALLSNHGAGCCGKNLDEAFEVARVVEQICKIFILSSCLGKTKVLPEEGREYQRAMFEMKKEF
ncbi:MAG: class II aldolase/adducin family protein [Thermoplasmata archaeon]|nr:MAG: class II aldolase/adducin family protein [Thermoplasmata archaeon]